MTLRRSFLRSVWPILALGSFALSFLVFSALGPSTSTELTDGDVRAPARATPGPVDELIAEHSCWSGRAPADMEGKLPGHVVITRPGAAAPTLGGPEDVGRAMEKVFDGRHPRLQVHAFCR